MFCQEADICWAMSKGVSISAGGSNIYFELSVRLACSPPAVFFEAQELRQRNKTMTVLVLFKRIPGM